MYGGKSQSQVDHFPDSLLYYTCALQIRGTGCTGRRKERRQRMGRLKEKMAEFRRRRWQSKAWIRFCFMLDRVESLYREFIRDPVWRFNYELKLKYWDLQRRAIRFWVGIGVLEVVKKDEAGREDRYEEINFM